MTETSAKSGRGLVVSGGILSGLSLVMTGAAVVYFIVGIQDGPEAMSMIFPFLLLGWLTIAGPAWFIGLPLLAIGRSQQRGPVRGATAAWIVALMGLPTVGLLLASAASGATWVFYALIAAIPLSIVAMIGGLAWLVWGKPSHAM